MPRLQARSHPPAPPILEDAPAADPFAGLLQSCRHVNGIQYPRDPGFSPRFGVTG